jgi:SAM-dependent methyltransferase
MLERMRDPLTVRRLQRLGVTAGWRCLEVGAGAGSIARWLSHVVGPTGQVVAIDIDTRLMQSVDESNIEVRTLDLLGAEWDLAGFDLVHARALVHHLPDRQERAVARLISALRPGGWLLLEEPNVTRAAQFQLGPWGQLLAAFTQLPQVDFAWAPAMPALLAESLIETGTESDMAVGTAASEVAEFGRLSLKAVRAPLLATGAVDADLLAAAEAQLNDGTHDWLSGMEWIAAWGRTPTG